MVPYSTPPFGAALMRQYTMATTRNNRESAKASADSWQHALYIPLTILAWLAVAVVAGWLLGHVAKTVLTLVLSGVVAFALTPLVSMLTRWLPRILSITIAYILGFALVFGLLSLLIFTAASQVTDLARTLPDKAHQIKHLEPQIVRVLGPVGVTKKKFNSAQQRITGQLQNIGEATARDSISIVSTVLGTIIDIILVLILSIYLTANGARIGVRLRQEAPNAQRRHIVLLIDIVNQVVGGYIRGQLLLALLIGTLVGVGMAILKVPYPVLLGVLAFFMEFIPVIGVLVSGSVCVVIALFQGWITALIVLGYFVFVHVVEGEVVGPRIMARAVGIHPATAIVALVAGTELFGIWGALFGAPLAGLVQAIGTAAWKEFRGGDPRAVLNAVAKEGDREAGVGRVASEDDPAKASPSGSKPVSSHG